MRCSNSGMRLNRSIPRLAQSHRDRVNKKNHRPAEVTAQWDRTVTTWQQRNLKRIAALGAVVALYWFARLPTISDAERTDLASRFKFDRTELPDWPGVEKKSIRTVHRDMNSFAAWISSLGAAVALNDLDGDGLENDLCHVDPRTDRAVVSPVPGTGDRFKPFDLLPKGLLYDPTTMAPMGCLPGDVNEDGLLDVVVYYWGRTPVAFIRTAKSLAPDSFIAQEIAVSVERWFTNSAAFTDLDGDTHADLVLCNYFPDGADILNPNSTEPQHMQDSMSRAYNGGKKHVYLWKSAKTGDSPAVEFAEVTGLFPDEINLAWTLGIGAADLDGDLLPEIYFANDFGPDRLMHNRSMPGRLEFAQLSGVKDFTTPNSKVLGRDSYKGMSVDFGDLNGDGRFDIYVSNIAEEFALEESHFAYVSAGDASQMKAGIAPYRDDSEALGLSRSGWGWDTRLADFDNDGVLEAIQATGFIRGEKNRWPELHELAMANDAFVKVTGAWANYQPGDDMSGRGHVPFFVRAANGRFQDIAPDIGLGETQISRGIATADVDGDGDLDFAIANQWEPSYFFRNSASNSHKSLALSIRLPIRAASHDSAENKDADTSQTRAAIGAIATVTLPDGRKLVAQVDGGSGHSGKRGHEVHFGLGKIAADAKLNVEVRWRSGDKVESQRFDLVPGRHTLILQPPSPARGAEA